MTIRQAIEQFIIDRQIKGNSSYTVKYYTETLEYFIMFTGDIEIESINLDILRKYYLHHAGRDISTVTVQTYMRAVRAFLSWCFDEEYIHDNLSLKFKLPKAKRRTIDVLTDNEIRTLFESFNDKEFIDIRNKCICLLMLDSGLRLNEVVTMRRDCVHLAEGYAIVTGKGNKERIIPLGLNTKKSLMRYMVKLPFVSSDTALFVKDRTIGITRETVRQIFRKIKSDTGITRLKPHLLRHTFATRYLENGGDIYSLQLILGHTSLEMVKKYVHTTPRKTAVVHARYSPVDNLLK